MRRYIEHMQNNRTPHERRQHAMQVATIITALLFVAWLASLGMRLGGKVPVAEDNAANSAATLNAVQDENNSTLLGY